MAKCHKQKDAVALNYGISTNKLKTYNYAVSSYAFDDTAPLRHHKGTFVNNVLTKTANYGVLVIIVEFELANLNGVAFLTSHFLEFLENTFVLKSPLEEVC